MTARPRDWSPLDLGGDPTPGDPHAVARAGRHYRDVAEAIRTASVKLREIANGPEMKSEAVSAFVEQTGEVAEEIQRAHERYDGVGEALTEYAPALQAAQDDADDALRRATTAQQELQSAQLRLNHAESDFWRAQRDAMLAPPEAPPADLAAHRAAIRRADNERAAAQADIDRAKADADRAREAWERAAKRARDRIEDVKDSGDLNDSRWDKVADVLSKIADVAGIVAAAAGLLALAVSWIPVVGQALAAVLGTIALIGGLVSLLANVALLIGGKGSVQSVVLDVVSLATFGIGRAVVGGTRAAYRGAQGMARLRAGQLAAQSPAIRVAAGLPAGSATSAIRSMLGGNTAAANLSRSQARNMVTSARSVPMFSARAPFRAAWDDGAAFLGNARTAFDPNNLRRAVQETPDAVRAIGNSRSSTELLARLTGNGDALAHAQFENGLHAALRQGAFNRANGLTAVTFGSTAVAGGIDGYQFGSSTVWPDVFNRPADRLDLPADGVGAR